MLVDDPLVPVRHRDDRAELLAEDPSHWLGLQQERELVNLRPNPYGVQVHIS